MHVCAYIIMYLGPYCRGSWLAIPKVIFSEPCTWIGASWVSSRGNSCRLCSSRPPARGLCCCAVSSALCGRCSEMLSAVGKVCCWLFLCLVLSKPGNTVPDPKWPTWVQTNFFMLRSVYKVFKYLLRSWRTVSSITILFPLLPHLYNSGFSPVFLR